MSNTTLKNESSVTTVVRRRGKGGPAQSGRPLPGSEDIYQILAENASDLIFRLQLAPVFRFDYVSSSSYRITGYTPQEFYDDPQLMMKCIHPEDVKLLEAFHRSEAPFKYKSLITRWIRKDGQIVWLEYKNTVSFNKRGEPEFVNVIARDITERKEAEEALRESQRFSMSLLENAPHATVVINPDFTVNYVNPAWERLNGWKLKEIVGMKAPFPWWPEEEWKTRTKSLKKCIWQGSGHYEARACKKNGERYWVAMNWTSVIKDGKPLYILVNSVDITERKQMEEALRQSEERFSKAFRSSPEMIILADLEEGKYIEVNDSFVQTTGYSREELIGHTSQDCDMWLSPDEEARMAHLLNKYGKFNNKEFSFRMKSGEIRTWLCSAEIITLGGVPCMQAVATDVTEHKQVDEALRQSEEKFSKAFQASPASISVSTLKEGRFIEVNESFLRDKGYTREEVIGRTSAEINLFGKEGDRQKLLQVLQDEGRFQNIQVEYHTKTGEVRTGLLSAELITIENEPCVIFINTDITKRIKAMEQLRMLGSVTQQVTDATIVTDRDFTITYVNQAAQNLLGYSSEEMLGQKLGFADARQPSRKRADRISDMAAAGRVWSGTLTKRRKDGTAVICECRLSPLYDDNGQLKSYIDVQRDVTRQREMEAKLQVHKRLIESILATMPGGVLVIDNKGRVLLANQSFHKIFNTSQRELRDRTLNEVMPVNQLLNSYQAVKKGKKNDSVLEFRKQVGDLEKIIAAHVIRMDGGRTLLTFTDISQDREEQEKLYLTDRLASIGEMAAGLAHELNNPLTGILALSQLLVDSEIPEEYCEDIECINTEAKRAAEIVKNVLLFTRNNNYENGQASANEVVRDVLRLREYEEKAGNIEVVTNLEEDLPAVAIDKFQLQQVFLNIISNAEAAIRETGRPGTLKVTTEKSGQHVKIHFTDNGCGIKKQVMPRIFDPFFTTKEIGKGTGLGLSICYGIVVKHQGKISVKSQVDKGTTFTIKMPVAE
jgi:PAS domain S-box-containing protein